MTWMRMTVMMLWAVIWTIELVKRIRKKMVPVVRQGEALIVKGKAIVPNRGGN